MVIVFLGREGTVHVCHSVDGPLLVRPKDYSGIEELKIPSSAIWLPDIVLYNT